jgi:hypothetical protein
MSRRYKIGQNIDYDNIYDLKLRQSDLLNSASMPNPHTRFLTRANLEMLKLEYTGDSSGKTTKDGTTIKANLPALKERLDDIDKNFAAIKKRALSEGKDVPEQLPPKEQEEKILCEALYDVRTTELEYIQELLDNYVEVEEKTNDADVLRHGPIGSAVLKGGTISMIDGCKCSVNEDGIPFINDDRSRYNGMSTAEYYKKIVSPFQKARRENQRQIEKEIREGKVLRENVSKGKLQGSAPWPEIPEGTKLYNQKISVE